MIVVRGYSQSFGKKDVLKEVDFSIEGGGMVGLIGPSGSGKTTLINSLIGLQVPTKGTVHVFNEQQPTLKVSKQIEYMAQSDALYDDLTPKGNLKYFGKLYGLRKKKLAERMEYVLRFVDLTRDADRPIHSFSGGMKRRLSLHLRLLESRKLIFCTATKMQGSLIKRPPL